MLSLAMSQCVFTTIIFHFFPISHDFSYFELFTLTQIPIGLYTGRSFYLECWWHMQLLPSRSQPKCYFLRVLWLPKLPYVTIISDTSPGDTIPTCTWCFYFWLNCKLHENRDLICHVHHWILVLEHSLTHSKHLCIFLEWIFPE